MIYDRERPSFEPANNVTVKRCFYAYEFALDYVKGKSVADIGCGTGYGTIHLATAASNAIGLDYSAETVAQNLKDNAAVKNLTFMECIVPPICLPDASYDVITAFQFIEHLDDPKGFIKDSLRVLKPGGVFLCTTVNAKKSMARNPFHKFEYTFAEMEKDFREVYSALEIMGLQGNDKVNAYYRENEKWVKSILKWDILGLHKILPSSLISVPYNFLTSIMRRQLMDKNQNTTAIDTSDFFLVNEKAQWDNTWDIFMVARKPL